MHAIIDGVEHVWDDNGACQMSGQCTLNGVRLEHGYCSM